MTSPRQLELRAPAKVNLGLRIAGVRADGYHLIDSLFVPLDLADRLRLVVRPAPSPAVRLSLSGELARGLPDGPDNLASRAARAFLEAAGIGAEVEIDLDKQIPSGGGLGGGSSDAAAVLRGLGELFADALRPGRLEQLALSLGADVPFFLDPRPSRVTGVGELVEPLEEVPSLALLLANPGVSLATAEVYAAWDQREGALTRNRARPTMPPASGRGFDASSLSELLANDLEPPAVRLCPPIASLEEHLESLGALAVGMSGSGATVFGVFDDRAAAEDALVRGRFATSAPAGEPIWVRVASTQPSP